ncbi:3'-5' exonuclease [Prauserella muralis]|uniref:Uncharacterized protein n=1 Tax=Prauserella muralis TaxID=588067 RepID=A0A2V4AKM0_9PSEU|nr:3'-5' exonuclease [Prauserella muralis]PXY20851.1 hypothetical protein BAY60_25440 [Prauserella muralis]TWE29888.1 DNA polymerase III epsilon subunit-like protein [Prauserella muralis]
MTDVVFLDTETTGLDPLRHEVWEVAYAVNDGPIVTAYLPHSLRTADPAALEMNGYWDRAPVGMSPCFGALADVELRRALTGVTVVGSNPAFDTAFLRARWGVAPWHYRLLDVATYAMPVLGYDRPASLKTVTDAVRANGFEVPEPDHSAAGDVETLRAVYSALAELAGRRRR